MSTKNFAWRAYCEGCQWVGPIRPSDKSHFFGGENQDARLDLASHYTDKRHWRDTLRPGDEFIGSWGVELLYLQRAATMAKKLSSVD